MEVQKTSWLKFKTFITSRDLPIHTESENDDKIYYLEAYDGPVARSCVVQEGTFDYDDFVSGYLSEANNQSLTDSNGITLQRTKITRTGWHYQAHSIEMTSSKLGGVFNSGRDQTDLGYADIKFYAGETELVSGTQAELDANCDTTVIVWEPDHDVEVLGGVLFQAAAPAGDFRLWITAIPDVPAFLGGSIPFIQGGLNLKYMGTGQIFDVDGRTPKLLPYNPIIHTNKFEMKLCHDVGAQHSLLFVAKVFREAK